MSQAKLKRRWFRFSLRSLCIVFTLLTVWLGFTVGATRRQREAVDFLLRNGGCSIDYDYQYKPSTAGRLGITIDRTLTPSSPRWLRTLTGEDFFHTPINLDLNWKNRAGAELDLEAMGKLTHLRCVCLFVGAPKPQPGQAGLLNDSDLAVLANLIELESLTICATGVGDSQVFGSGLIHLTNLPRLKILNLLNMPITDSGLESISKLKSLKELNLAGCTSVTDQGVEHIGEMTNLDGLYLMRTRVTNTGLGSLYRLTQLTSLGIGETVITPRGVRKFHERMPKVSISGYYKTTED